MLEDLPRHSVRRGNNPIEKGQSLARQNERVVAEARAICSEQGGIGVRAGEDMALGIRVLQRTYLERFACGDGGRGAPAGGGGGG